MLTAIRRARRVRARVRHGGADAGITLTELIVTMTLMSIVGALALGWMIGSTTASNATTTSSLGTAEARTAVASWADLLGVMTPADADNPGVPKLTITPTSLSFTAQLANKSSACADVACPTSAGKTVTLALSNGRLVRTIGGSGTQYLTDSGVAATGTCLFTLYSAAGNAYSACDNLTPAQVNLAARVDFAFTVTPSGGTPADFGTSVSLPGAS